MPSTSVSISRWTYDLDGNGLSYTTITANESEVLPVYKTDGGPSLTGTFAYADGLGNAEYNYGYKRIGATVQPQWKLICRNFLGTTTQYRLYITEYDPQLPPGLPVEFFWYFPGVPGGYSTSGIYDFTSAQTAPYNFTFGPFTPDSAGVYGNGRYQVFGSVSQTYDRREITISGLSLEKNTLDIQSKNPFVKFTGKIVVYPNVSTEGLGAWKPSGDIPYRIKLRTSNPSVPGGLIVLNGVIPEADISEPDSNGVIASFEITWDGREAGTGLYCETVFTPEMRILAQVPSGNTTAVATGPPLHIVNCKGKRFNKFGQAGMDVPVFPGADSEVNPSFAYLSLSNTEAPASMGYGWFSTENIRVFEVEEDESLAYCDGGSWLRWLKTSGGYEAMMPDNKATMAKNSSSTSARYVITWRDGYCREFDTDGRLRRTVDRNGRTTTFERFSSYLMVQDDQGRTVYHHYSSGAQPTVINDNANPALGRRWLLDYYGTSDPLPGRLKSLTDPAGDQTMYLYNAAGRISEIREVRPTEGNRSTLFSYGNGVLARLTQVLVRSTKGSVTTNHYVINYSYGVAVPGHSGGYVTTQVVVRDLESNTATTDKVFYLAYDGYARLIAEFELLKITGSGATEVRTYLETYYEYSDPNDPYLVTKVTAPNGAITQSQYTARGNVKKVIDAQGNETIYSYVEEDSLHPAYATFPDLVTQVRRPAPDQDNAPTVFYPPTRFAYNASNGDLLSVEDAQGKLTYLRYNSTGKIDRTIDRLGFKTYMKYDVKARLSEIHVQKSLAPTPLIEELVDEDAADFRSVVLSYDGYDNVTGVLDSNGNSMSTTYDAVDRPLTVTDGNDVDTVFSYVDRVLKQVELPDNNAPGSNVRLAKLEHDALGRTTAVKRQDSNNAAQLRVGFAYNGFSQLKALKRLKNGVEKSHTVDSWDRQGRVLSSTDANGKASTAAYEPYCVGQASTSARGVRTKTSFDTLCRLTKVETGSPHATNPLEMGKTRETRDFQYDDLGRPTKTLQKPPARYGQAVFGQSRYGGQTEERSYEFDSLDRLKKVTFEDGKTMEYEHDFEGNVTQVTENASGSTPKVTQFSYFGDGRLYQVTYVRSGGNQVFTYSYDPGGRPLALTYPTSTGIVAHFTGPSAEVGWDGNGQLLHLRYVKGGTTLIRRFAFGYDPAGNRISQLDVTPSKATSWSYGYDWLDRLETVKKAEAATVAGLGALQLVSVYQYDAADNRILFEVPNLSNPALTETYRSSYDFADNITLLEKKVGSGPYATLESFTSDDDGNLTGRTRGGVTTSYRWDDFNRLASITTSDNSRKQSHTFGVNGFRRKKKDKNDVETTEYAAGLATAVSKSSAETVTYLMGHQIMGFEKSGNFYWLIQDGLSTTRDVVNSSGSVVASYEFSEYGARISPINTGGVESQKTWVGGLFVQDEVAETGLMMMGHRFYEPSLGRFLSRDPIGFAGGLNLYSYVSNRPSSAVDPEGLRDPREPYSQWEFAMGRELPPTPPVTSDEVVNTIAGTLTVVALIEAAPGMAMIGGGMLMRVGISRGAPLFMWGLEASTGTGVAAATVTGGGAAAARSGRGVGNPANRAAVYNGNEMHYDCLNGGRGYAGSGVGAPAQLQNRFPRTQFEFAPRGAAGVDVRVTGGTHPSQYQGSTWPAGANTADFKPYTASGMSAVPREIAAGKLPPGTLPIYYEPYNGVLRTP